MKSDFSLARGFWRTLLLASPFVVVAILLLFLELISTCGCSRVHSRTLTAIYATNTAVFQAISATETSKAATETSQTATAVKQIADATEMARIQAIPLPRFPVPR